MLQLFGYGETIRSIYKLSQTNHGKGITDIGSLRDQYLQFLSRTQDYPVNRAHDPFIHDGNTEEQLALAYVEEADIDDMAQSTIIGSSFDTEERESRIDQLRGPLQETLDLDESLRNVFNTVIHSIFVKQTNIVKADGSTLKAFGGSSSNAIGTIWVSTNRDLEDVDFAELFIHELTHHLVFIDEYNHHHFNYELMAKPENYALSAIRGTKRPLDKVIHSIVVSAEVLLSRERFLDAEWDIGRTVHPETGKLAADTLSAINSVWSLPNLDELLTPRAIELTRASEEAIKEITSAKGLTC